MVVLVVVVVVVVLVVVVVVLEVVVLVVVVLVVVVLVVVVVVVVILVVPSIPAHAWCCSPNRKVVLMVFFPLCAHCFVCFCFGEVLGKAKIVEGLPAVVGGCKSVEAKVSKT